MNDSQVTRLDYSNKKEETSHDANGVKVTKGLRKVYPMVPSTRPKTRNLLVGNGSSNFMAAVSIVAARFFTYEALSTLKKYIYILCQQKHPQLAHY